MKKARDFTILLFATLLTLQFVTNFFKFFHEINYNMSFEDNIYEINEKFYKANNNYYEIEVKDEENSFLFTTNKKMNKQKKIVEELYVYDKNNVKCVAIRLKNDGTINNEPQCALNNNLYTFSYISKMYPDILEFTTNLSEENLYNDNFKVSNNEEDVHSTMVIKDNLTEDMFLGIWNYRSITLVGDNRIRNVGVTSRDIYENNMSAVIGKYYIMPRYDKDYESKSYTRLNIESSVVDQMEFDKPLNNNSFIQGVVDDKLYLFDNSNLVQYTIDPINNLITELGNKEKGVLVFEKDKFVNKTVHEIKDKNEPFNLLENDDLKEYQYDYLYVNDNSYFIHDKGSIYQIYKNHLDKPILIFEDKDLIEFRFNNGFTSFIIKDTLYYYNPSFGLKPLASNNEFLFNNNNHYFIYVK